MIWADVSLGWRASSQCGIANAVMGCCSSVPWNHSFPYFVTLAHYCNCLTFMAAVWDPDFPLVLCRHGSMAHNVGNLPQKMCFYAIHKTIARRVDIHQVNWIRLRTPFLSLGQICLGMSPYFYIPYKKFRAGQKKIMGNAIAGPPNRSFLSSLEIVRPDMLSSSRHALTFAHICTATLP